MNDKVSIVVEEYLQAIYSLLSNDKPVKAVTMAKLMKNSPSTVHATLTRMQRDGLIVIGKKKEIQFTAKGMEKAESLTGRHRLVESFLCNTLGISWHEVHKHAHILEHGLTPLVVEKLAEFLDFPKSCPHGTPIPGENSILPALTEVITEFEVGDSIEIVVIDESLEESLDIMKFLQEKRIIPGEKHHILEKTDVTKTIVLATESGMTTLSFDLADKIRAVKQTS
ncbi:metal-dependent transcriptional regulator [bacterium]|nr:metal-dependent transcriptional regulator [bacterium]